MKRDDGFYWVKQTKGDDWEVMRWEKRNGVGVWHDTYQYTQYEESVYQINEERIKTPDE